MMTASPCYTVNPPKADELLVGGIKFILNMIQDAVIVKDTTNQCNCNNLGVVFNLLRDA